MPVISLAVVGTISQSELSSLALTNHVRHVVTHAVTCGGTRVTRGDTWWWGPLLYEIYVWQGCDIVVARGGMW